MDTAKPDTVILVETAKHHQLTYLALFGYYARGQAKFESDVDLYARFGRPVGLFEVLAVKHKMEDALGLPVDLIAEEAVVLHQFVRKGMAKDLVVLYEN